MMNTKQQTLIYLMEESNKLSTLCMRQVPFSTVKNTSKTKMVLEHQIGSLMSALKEVITEFELDGDRIVFTADLEVSSREHKKVDID
jgi:hypothetical protein